MVFRWIFCLFISISWECQRGNINSSFSCKFKGRKIDNIGLLPFSSEAVYIWTCSRETFQTLKCWYDFDRLINCISDILAGGPWAGCTHSGLPVKCIISLADASTDAPNTGVRQAHQQEWRAGNSLFDTKCVFVECLCALGIVSAADLTVLITTAVTLNSFLLSPVQTKAYPRAAKIPTQGGLYNLRDEFVLFCLFVFWGTEIYVSLMLVSEQPSSCWQGFGILQQTRALCADLPPHPDSAKQSVSANNGPPLTC